MKTSQKLKIVEPRNAYILHKEQICNGACVRACVCVHAWMLLVFNIELPNLVE